MSDDLEWHPPDELRGEGRCSTARRALVVGLRELEAEQKYAWDR